MEREGEGGRERYGEREREREGERERERERWNKCNVHDLNGGRSTLKKMKIVLINEKTGIIFTYSISNQSNLETELSHLTIILSGFQVNINCVNLDLKPATNSH